MSFYGNISNASRTNLTFDKVYPNRMTMDNAVREDGVMIGRYVLVEYDDSTEPNRLEFFLKKSDANDINLAQKDINTIKDNSEKILIEKAIKRVGEGFNLYYWLNKPQPDRPQGNYEKHKPVCWVEKNQGIEGYRIEEGDVVRARIQLDNSYEPVYADLNKKVTTDYINPKSDQYSLFYFFKAVKYNEKNAELNEPGNPILFEYLGVSNEEKGVFDDYSRNYLTDKEAYKHLEWKDSGYDSTIWQKSIVEGQPKYLQIASLNSEFPRINIIPEAPSTDNVIQPYIDAKGTNKTYSLHFPTQWGFKIKTLDKNDKKDIIVSKTDEEGNIIYDNNKQPIKEYLDIYYNKDGFNKEKHSKSNIVQDDYILLNKAKSGKKYLKSDGVFDEAFDIQEMSISLPSLGDAVCDIYDTLYGVYDEEGNLLEERNFSYGWKAEDGERAILYGVNGSRFSPESYQSVAGVINSTLDLMGQNIEINNDLSKANGNTIYYVDYGKLTDTELEEKQKIGYVGPNFYRKTEKIIYEPISNDSYSDYDITTENGRRYFKLDQFEKDIYYTKTNLNDNHYNYYLSRNIIPDTSATYYHKDTIETKSIKLLQWIPYIPDEDGNLPEALYYKEEQNFMQVGPEDTPKNIDYYNITATQVTYPNEDEAPEYTKTIFYNPEQYISKEDPTRHDYSEDKTKYDEAGKPIPDENGHIYYTGYFYLDETDNNKLIPVTNEPYIQNEEYYLIENYYIDKAQAGADIGEIDAYYVIVHSIENETLGQEIAVPLIKDNIDKYIGEFKINLLEFIQGRYYKIEQNKEKTITNYIIQNNKEDIKAEEIYYSIISTQITGKKLETNPDGSGENIDVKFYEPNKYYYLEVLTDKGLGNYLLDKREKLTNNTQYFADIKVKTNTDGSEISTSGSIFYAPNIYYYATPEGIIKLDSSEIRTVPYNFVNGKREILDGYTLEDYIHIDENGNELAYFLPRTIHVKNDKLGIYTEGALWDKPFAPPEEIELAVRKYPGEEGTSLEDFNKWELLAGYSEDFNTINGIILNSAKKFENGNIYSRNEETIQGGLNRLKDQLDNFTGLKEKQFVMVDGYGRVNNCEPESDRWLEIKTDSWTYYDAKGDIIDIDKVTENNWVKRELAPRIRLDHAEPGEAIGTVGQSADQVLNFNQSFTSSRFATDLKGHVVSTEEHTITLPTLSINNATNGKVMTDLDLDQTGKFTIKENFVGNLPITEYAVGATASNIVEATDTLNQALGKLQGQLNLLNADSKTTGSVLNTIIKTVVEADDNNAVDRLTEIADWIVKDETGTAELIADIENNTKAISANKTAIETNLANYEADKILINGAIDSNDADILALQNLVGEKSVETQISEAITAENLAQYALATELDTAEERITAIEENIENWNKAEENIQSNWLEEDETSDAYIQNKPNLSDVVKLDTTFDYVYNETITAMTISTLMEKIAELEARIAILENPVSPEPEPEPEIPEEEPTE